MAVASVGDVPQLGCGNGKASTTGGTEEHRGAQRTPYRCEGAGFGSAGIVAATGADCSGMRRCATSSYMRKWMSERLKRRKKPGDISTKEPTKAPEPLQRRLDDKHPGALAA